MLIGQYTRVANIKRDVNVRRYNRIQYNRKIALACFAAFVHTPRLVKKVSHV